MNSSFSTNKRKKEKNDCHSIKKKKKLSIIEGICMNNTFNDNKKEKNINKNLVNIKGNFIKKEEYKKIKKNNKSLKLEISSIPKTIYQNKNYLTIIHSNNKKEENYQQNSFNKNNKVNKNKNTSNQVSFAVYNYTAKRINRKKTIQEEIKPKKSKENNYSINEEKSKQKNNKYFTLNNYKNITNNILKYKIDKDESLNSNKIEYKNKIRII